jgi:ankyrin repeat protein
VNQSTNETALHLALHEEAQEDNASSEEMIALLLAHGANINAIAYDVHVEEGELPVRRTPLHYAVEMNDEKAVLALLENGADVGVVKDSNGYTLLDMTLKAKNGTLTQALIKQGAKTSAQPTPEAIASAMFGVFASQKRSSETGLDSSSKRMKK